jgi:hypothetical protein
MKEWNTFVDERERRYHMPEVRLDMDGEILDKKKEESPARAKKSLGILALRLSMISHMIFLDFLDLLKSTVYRRVVHSLAEVRWRAVLIFNGGARILRAITSYTEFHLSPSYVLFNLKALSVVIDRKAALGERLLPVVDIVDCCRR